MLLSCRVNRLTYSYFKLTLTLTLTLTRAGLKSERQGTVFGIVYRPHPPSCGSFFFYIFASLPSVWYHAQQTAPVPFRRNAVPYVELIFEIILDRRHDGCFFRLEVRGPA
jgi:hypothetical protein